MAEPPRGEDAPAPKTRPPTRPKPRDVRLDVLRGAALATIFLTHVPGNLFEGYTLREWGFSDAAEGFVLMAGVSAGLAYGPAFRPGGDALRGTMRVWGRAWTLYLVHLLVTTAAFGIAAGLALWADAPGLLHLNGIDALLLRPVETMVAVPLLLHQLAYANILPLYAAFLLLAPAALWLGQRRPGLLLAGSLLLWAAAGTWRLNLPSWPVPGGWPFSPFSWQAPFVVGLLVGLRMREGRRLVPLRADLLALAGTLLLVALLWRTVPAFGGAMNGLLARLAAEGAPWVLVSFHKTWDTAPRLLHALALAYVLSVPLLSRVCEGRWAEPFALLGRHALPVFGLGSILAFLLQGVRTETGADPRLDGALLLGGLLLQLALARARDGLRARSGRGGAASDARKGSGIGGTASPARTGDPQIHNLVL